MNSKDYIPVKLEVLSPVHIGSGQDLDPFGYVIKENSNGEPFLYFIDIALWLESQPLADVTAYFASHNFADVRKFLYERIEDPEPYALVAAPVKDRGIFETYKSVVLGKKPENRMLLDPALKNPLTLGLIVPGSSVKGAIHTAILDYFDREYNLKLRERKKRDNRFNPNWELFGKPKDSAFKALKISDFEAIPGDAYIVSAKEKSIKEDKQPTPKSNCEITRSLLMDGSPFEMFGKIALGFQRKSQGSLVLGTGLEVEKFKESFDFSRLCKVVTDFYRKRFLNEWEKFYTLPHFRETAKALKPLKEMVENDAHWSNAMLLRLGHYSHIECVTITNNAPRTRKRKDGKGFYPYGTTRTLANGVYPFGWVRLSRITEAEYRKGIASFEERIREALKERTQRAHEFKEEQKRDEAKRKREKEEQQRSFQADYLENFRVKVESCQNLPGEIGSFLQDVKNQESKSLREEMCRILLRKANSLKKNKKFSKALKNDKAWALQLKGLLDENGISIDEG